LILSIQILIPFFSTQEFIQSILESIDSFQKDFPTLSIMSFAVI
jgi:hypothetical protein